MFKITEKKLQFITTAKSKIIFGEFFFLMQENIFASSGDREKVQDFESERESFVSKI